MPSSYVCSATTKLGDVFPVNSLLNRESGRETGSLETMHTAIDTFNSRT